MASGTRPCDPCAEGPRNEQYDPRAEGPTRDSQAGMTTGMDKPDPVMRMSFGEALDALQRGQRVARAGWNGRGQYLELQVPDKHSKMTLPYIYIRTVQGDLVPWLASQSDMLSRDWCLVSEETVMRYAGLPFVVSKEGNRLVRLD